MNENLLELEGESPETADGWELFFESFQSAARPPRHTQHFFVNFIAVQQVIFLWIFLKKNKFDSKKYCFQKKNMFCLNKNIVFETKDINVFHTN